MKKISLISPLLLCLFLFCTEISSADTPPPTWNHAIPIGADKLHDLGISGEGGSILITENFNEESLQHPIFCIENNCDIAILEPLGGSNLRHGINVSSIAGGNEWIDAPSDPLSQAYVYTPSRPSFIGVAPNSSLLIAPPQTGEAYALSLVDTEKLVVNSSYPRRSLIQFPSYYPDEYQNVIFVSSAGNDGHGDRTLVNIFAHEIVVGGVYIDEENHPILWGGSSYGGYQYPILKPDLVAPAVNQMGANGVDEYIAFTGTSQATPHVAGAASLLQQAHPTWSSAEIKSALMLTADPVYLEDGTQATPIQVGSGYVNVYDAYKTPVTMPIWEYEWRTHSTVTGGDPTQLNYPSIKDDCTECQWTRTFRNMTNDPVTLQFSYTGTTVADVTFSSKTIIVPPWDYADIEMSLDMSSAEPTNWYYGEIQISTGDPENPLHIPLLVTRTLPETYVNSAVMRSESDSSGTSWENPFATIQEAIDATSSDGTIHLAEGTYIAPNSQGIIFEKNITVLGGYRAEDDRTGFSILSDDLMNDDELFNGWTPLNGRGNNAKFTIQLLGANLGETPNVQMDRVLIVASQNPRPETFTFKNPYERTGAAIAMKYGSLTLTNSAVIAHFQEVGSVIQSFEPIALFKTENTYIGYETVFEGAYSGISSCAGVLICLDADFMDIQSATWATEDRLFRLTGEGQFENFLFDYTSTHRSPWRFYGEYSYRFTKTNMPTHMGSIATVTDSFDHASPRYDVTVEMESSAEIVEIYQQAQLIRTVPIEEGIITIPRLHGGIYTIAPLCDSCEPSPLWIAPESCTTTAECTIAPMMYTQYLPVISQEVDPK